MSAWLVVDASEFVAVHLVHFAAALAVFTPGDVPLVELDPISLCHQLGAVDGGGDAAAPLATKSTSIIIPMLQMLYYSYGI